VQGEPIRVGSVFDPYARGPMAWDGAAPRFREDKADIAVLQRQVQDAQQELQRVERKEGLAETAWCSAEERASACQRFLEGLREIERPATPAWDLLWDLMGGDKGGSGRSEQSLSGVYRPHSA